ncbi:MAG: LytTR family transcriptional regulator DNA-binding domain-containing protein [Bacteroidetes bacterium]|nr:LytTR family transcriptional regulator DNA-binding domain-containing protein [Bacteroidota bacterium]
MKKAIIIDDEEPARELIKEYLASWADLSVVAECADGFDGIKAIQKHNPFVIFLDIQMPKINGFEMLELLTHSPIVIFTTAYDEFALKAFEASAADYLLKPFSKQRFDLAIQKILQLPVPAEHNTLTTITNKHEEESVRIVLQHQGEIRIIPVPSVLCIEAWDDYVKIHSTEGVFVKKQSLTYYEKTLSEQQFVRVHRSFLVQMAAISAIEAGQNDGKELRLRNGMHIPASRSGYRLLKEKMKL